MATMVKEKRKEKKKPKDKSSSRSSATRELTPVTEAPSLTEEAFDHTTVSVQPLTQVVGDQQTAQCTSNTGSTEKEHVLTQHNPEELSVSEKEQIITTNIFDKQTLENTTQLSSVKSSLYDNLITEIRSIDTESNIINEEGIFLSTEDSYRELSNKLERMAIPENVADISQEREFELVSPNAYLNISNLEQESPVVLEDTTPSAPCFEEIPEIIPYQEVFMESKPKVQSMPIEDLIRLYSGGEMEEVRTMSEREEEIVEHGPVSGPEHPLVDLLSTFRSSLMAVERERIQLANGFIDEEKSRNSLWKIEKRNAYVADKCPCGARVDLRATYEHAEFVRDRLPVAKMRLEGLLRDVQDSYCHHQHAALLAYYQIEELISETIQSNKNIIREALSLVLGALRLSASAPDALASALERWATALAAALIDHRDLRQLLFILHHLFKQSRSVRWASRVVQVRVDIESPQRVLALLELLLARPRLDTALECTEEAEDVWEEVDKHGDGGAVSEGTLRERDLLALLNALPIQDLVARILLFTHNEIKQARPHEWGDNNGGRGVLRACYGVRALLHVLRRATSTHGSYERLALVLRDIATRALRGLACLHLCSSEYYSRELKDKITAELEAAFFAGLQFVESRNVHQLPTSLLDEDSARQYCVTHIEHLHETSVPSCECRIRTVSAAAVERALDHELARTVLDFFMRIGLRKKSLQCKGNCDATARECIPQLLSAHTYLHTIALHMLADMNLVSAMESWCVEALHVTSWRPSTGELRALLDDWRRRCPALLQQLFMLIDCTPHKGVPIDVQLTIGTWLCSYIRSMPAGAPEWCWTVLRRLRTHRSSWLLPLDAPPPEDEPTDLFCLAYALVSSSWGHCIPLICSEGVSVLCKLSVQRPRDAVHCLAGLMLVMSHSPESVAFTPQFNEVFSSLLNWGPSLITRALGRGGEGGAELLMRLVLAQLDNEHAPRGAVLSAWLHALWRPTLPSSALSIMDSVACVTRLWPQLDAYANTLLQEENSKEHILHVVRHTSSAPLLCECLLRQCHAQHETLVHFGYARLLNALQVQRTSGYKIHVDNALQKVSANLTSEELVIYLAANAALVAPMSHPSHLTLWRLVIHLYLQRPPDYMTESTPPVGPLFFSGLIKSRTLNYMKKRLQETIAYHHSEATSLKAKKITESPPQSAKSSTKSSAVAVDDNMLPSLTIVDLTGESSDSSDSEQSVDDGTREQSTSDASEKKNIASLVCYHVAAERLIGEYLCWLEEGEKARAMPHHADIARFIPEHALEAAWKHAVTRPVPSQELDNFPLPTPQPPPDSTPRNTPFRTAVDAILKIKDRSRVRHRRTEIQSPAQDLDIKDARALMAVVDKHLKDIERLAQEWCVEVSRISLLDSKLWELVPTLRVARPLPSVRKQCANKCKPIMLVVQEREWCISLDAERGIRENRSNARSALRRLARARPHAARTAAALHAIARRTRSSEIGVRVVQRAWQCAGNKHCGDCSPAKTVLTALVAGIAERWICDNGRTCCQLISSWCKQGTNPLQQALVAPLLSPRRLAWSEWGAVYTALLDAQHLPSHTMFSYLSKFEMFRWSESADPTNRGEVLDAILRCIQRYGSTPSSEDYMLIEILGVHYAMVMTSQDLLTHVRSCAVASVQNKLPYSHWTHVVRAVDAKAGDVPFDQLGHLLRELGVLWWEARTGVRGSISHHVSAYAPFVARLLHSLQRAFVAAATALSYAPERVAWYAWSALQESWGAWISPHSGSAPLLPSTGDDEQYTPMVRHFVDSVHQIMLDCPGTEIHLLQQIFEWCVQMYVNVSVSGMTSVPGMTTVTGMTNVPGMTGVPSVTQESRVQASALLAELAKLPWNEHQWFYGKSLQVALQLSTSTDRELTSWCSSTWRGTTSDTLLRDVGEQLVPRLADLLYLFTASTFIPSIQILEKACVLPWYRLPERALEEALDRFYMIHHNPAQPYHDLPQFRLILLACELAAPPCGTPLQLSATSSRKRSLGISAWLRGATSPALTTHVAAHCKCLLNTIAALEPYLSDSVGELEELLSRGLAMMCIEPAASIALPVWVQWVMSATSRLVLACVSASGAVTAFEYCAALADAAVKTALSKHNLSWSEISSRWSESPWHESAPMALRVRLHIAYACVSAHAHTPQQTLAVLQALHTADIHFIENEVIIAVWICFAARVTSQCCDAEADSSARAILARWAEDERRSLLSRVTMQAQPATPTPLHRVLCRYAQYAISQDDATRKAFESAFTSALGANSNVTTWTIAPQHSKLVTLAIRLFPKYEYYFKCEFLQNVYV